MYICIYIDIHSTPPYSHRAIVAPRVIAPAIRSVSHADLVRIDR